jgi:hypothetical protein
MRMDHRLTLSSSSHTRSTHTLEHVVGDGGGAGRRDDDDGCERGHGGRGGWRPRRACGRVHADSAARRGGCLAERVARRAPAFEPARAALITDECTVRVRPKRAHSIPPARRVVPRLRPPHAQLLTSAGSPCMQHAKSGAHGRQPTIEAEHWKHSLGRRPSHRNSPPALRRPHAPCSLWQLTALNRHSLASSGSRVVHSPSRSCTHTHTHTHTHTNRHTHTPTTCRRSRTCQHARHTITHTHAHILTHSPTHILAPTSALSHARAHVHAHTGAHAYAHTDVHAHVHAHTDEHAHARAHSDVRSRSRPH